MNWPTGQLPLWGGLIISVLPCLMSPEILLFTGFSGLKCLPLCKLSSFVRSVSGGRRSGGEGRSQTLAGLASSSGLLQAG